MARKSLWCIISAAGMAVGLGAPALAQVTCGVPTPDGVVGRIQGPTNYTHLGDIDAFSPAADTCNVGTSVMAVDFDTPQHPILTANLYRLKTVDGAARFEQIGMSWNFHMFFALGSNLCCTGCGGPTNGDLNPRCSTSDTGSAMGQQTQLGPRWQVNAATGAFPFPAANPPFSGSVARRLQAAIADLDPTMQGGGQYFVEEIVVDPQDAQAGNTANNASFRPCSLTGANGEWTMSTTGTTAMGRAAMEAWRDADPQVSLVTVDVPGDGRFVVAGRATDLGGGNWRYEYAVMNLNSDRSGGSFFVTLPPGAPVANIGFHDVSYHDGDGPGNVNFSDTDWRATRDGAGLAWATESFEANQSANALRWGTLYNFRFDIGVPPGSGIVNIGLFKPGGPGSVAVVGLPIPAPPPPCLADWDGSGSVDSGDFFAFLVDFFNDHADFNHDGATTSQDFFDFLAAFFVGC